MSKTAELRIGDQTIELPIIEGSEGELAVDISKLRGQTGYITLDPGYANTGSCQSEITFIQPRLRAAPDGSGEFQMIYLIGGVPGLENRRSQIRCCALSRAHAASIRSCFVGFEHIETNRKVNELEAHRGKGGDWLVGASGDELSRFVDTGAGAIGDDCPAFRP